MNESLPGAGGVVRLRRFEGSPREFWPRFLEEVVQWVGANGASLISRRSSGLGGWRPMLAWGGPMAGVSHEELGTLADRAVAEGLAGHELGDGQLISIPLETEDEEHDVVLMVNLQSKEPSIGDRLQFVADTPALYQAFRRYRRAEHDIEHFANVIDLSAVLRKHRRFKSAALALCDELSARYRCQPVALGWRRGEYIRLQSLAQKPGFDRKMALVDRFEAAMEEVLDRDVEIVWSADSEDAERFRAQKELATELKAAHLLLVPLREDEAICGVLLLARTDREDSFSEKELNVLRLIADQLTDPLHRQEAADRWFGARIQRWGQIRARELWNLEHPWSKLGAVTLAIGLVVLFFGKMEYRVEATFIVRPQQQAMMPAPFDGYVDRLFFAVGDHVPENSPLLQLDTADLELRVVSLRADVVRFSSEAERARGEGRFAEMRVAEAQRAQAEAQLEQAEHDLMQARILAPFDGVLLDDGHLRERLGAPVSKGDILIRIARLDGLYADVDVFERDVHEVAEGAKGEIAFASQPDLKFPIEIRRVDPVAQTRETGAVFPAECDIVCPVEEWWRPGMTGIAKIEAGRRTFFWILTHRLVDWLHVTFWL